MHFKGYTGRTSRGHYIRGQTCLKYMCGQKNVTAVEQFSPGEICCMPKYIFLMTSWAVNRKNRDTCGSAFENKTTAATQLIFLLHWYLFIGRLFQTGRTDIATWFVVLEGMIIFHFLWKNKMIMVGSLQGSIKQLCFLKSVEYAVQKYSSQKYAYRQKYNN